MTGKVVAPPTLATPTSVTFPEKVFPSNESKRALASAPFSMLRMTEAGTETLTSISDQVEAVEVGGVFLYRKPAARHHLSFGEIVSRRSASKAAREPGTTSRPARPRRPQPAERPAPARDVRAAGAALENS